MLYKKRNVANKNQKVLEVESNKGLTSREHSTTKVCDDDVEVLPEDVSHSRGWIIKINAGMDTIEIIR